MHVLYIVALSIKLLSNYQTILQDPCYPGLLNTYIRMGKASKVFFFFSPLKGLTLSNNKYNSWERYWGREVSTSHWSPAAPPCLHCYTLPLYYQCAPTTPKKALFWHRLTKQQLALWCLNRLRVIITLKLKKKILCWLLPKLGNPVLFFSWFRPASACISSSFIILIQFLKYSKHPVLSLADPGLASRQCEHITVTEQEIYIWAVSCRPNSCYY